MQAEASSKLINTDGLDSPANTEPLLVNYISKTAAPNAIPASALFVTPLHANSPPRPHVDAAERQKAVGLSYREFAGFQANLSGRGAQL